MNLISKLTGNLRKKEFLFDNDEEHYIYNYGLMCKRSKDMFKLFKCVAGRERALMVSINGDVETNDLAILLMEQTGSSALSSNFSHAVVWARMYAQDFIKMANSNKKYSRTDKVCEELHNMVDYIKFDFYAHINKETRFKVKYINGKFVIPNEPYVKRLYAMINNVINQIQRLEYGIRTNNRQEVEKAYVELGLSKNFHLHEYERKLGL